ncbi:hypothetical protein TrRE_jg13200 [Triparma retinervis]|uniref:MYND-type domain-containing protein n=1 Tax=Triparma retinervis TaxID=2557542 RepID=A0A9W6ZQ78_9STRA|nr:hypothetical protein TrRE_jg13200 [Triparma retinervis]
MERQNANPVIGDSLHARMGEKKFLGRTKSGTIPSTLSEYLETTADGVPPLFPHPPRWPNDSSLKHSIWNVFCGGKKPSSMLYGMVLGPDIANYTNQRSMDNSWRLFLQACRGVGEDMQMNSKKMIEELLTPSGWEVDPSLVPDGDMSVKQFQMEIVSAMQTGRLHLTPSNEPSRQAKGLCEVCKTPCLSECICGENFCSRACLKKGWKTHQNICDTVIENNSIACSFTHLEFLLPKFGSGCSPNQVHGFLPWTGGLLDGEALDRVTKEQKQVCSDCGKVATKKLLKCGGCLATRYCNRDCQMRHWKFGHKKECKKLKGSAEVK